jgi:DNA-binding GntR family transcriptional regulator
MDALLIKLGDVPRTREEFVADRLRAAILRGDLKPGERLDENAIATLLGVSRTPVRSALRALAAESLIELHPHRGAIVTELTSDELEEIYLVREILEGMAARLAAPNMNDERIAALRVILEELENATDPDEWLALNDRFHHAIYQAANRPRMLSIIEHVRNIAAPYIRAFVADAAHMESSREDHRRMLEACVARDPVRAEEAVKRHLKDVCEAHVEFVEAVFENA